MSDAAELVILGCGPSDAPANAELGACRVCGDLTVLPEFGDGRCFGCTSDETDEAEGPRLVLLRPKPDREFVMLCDILSIFSEAQHFYRPEWRKKATRRGWRDG